MRGLWRLSWFEAKIFVREPLGAITTIGVPVLVFVVMGRMLGGQKGAATPSATQFLLVGLPVFVSVLIVISTVLSLVTIIAIYREGGILKRLRATPLRATTILTAHVLVKLGLTAATFLALYLVGRRFAPIPASVPLASFTVALLIGTWSMLSVGFVIASLVPTARFAQPVGAVILYPMLAVSGLFVPVDRLPHGLQLAARALPMTYMVSLLQGIWQGDSWRAHAADVGALALVFAVCVTIATRVFRWE